MNHLQVTLPVALLVLAFLLKLLVDREATLPVFILATLELPVDIAFLATSFIVAFTVAAAQQVDLGFYHFFIYLIGTVILIFFWRRSKVVAVTRDALREHLMWLLVGVFSPYEENLSERAATILVNDFLVTIESEHMIRSAALCEPSFLHSVEYLAAGDDFDPEPLAYFGGAGADSAAFFLAGPVGYVLLSNGTP